MHGNYVIKCMQIAMQRLMSTSYKLLVLIMLQNLDLQVRVYDLASMSCDYVLSGHTETVLCVDTCVSSSGRTLIVTGSKDKSVSFIFSVFL